jgi:predicted metal-dependent HD superfamily phosphohydrolase
MLLELTKRYSEPHRYYHTLEHIAQMFALAKRWDQKLSEVQQMAVWWHDAVYDPARNDNEYQSVRLLYQQVPWASNVIGRIILDTKDHKPIMPESHLVLDLDMAILGAENLKYRKYAKQVRREYRFAPDDLYRVGRADFLHKAMVSAEADKLFFTTHGKQLNETACENMRWELKQLREKKI